MPDLTEQIEAADSQLAAARVAVLVSEREHRAELRPLQATVERLVGRSCDLRKERYAKEQENDG